MTQHPTLPDSTTPAFRPLQQLHLLYLAALLMDMAVAGFIFAITRRAAELGASPLDLGLLGSVWMMAYTVVTLVSGRISDRAGRRNVALVGLAIAAVTTFACGLTTNVGLLLVLTAVFGLGPGCFWPAVIAWISEGAHGPRLLARLTTFGLAWNAGLLVGFGLTGVLYKHAPQAAFFVSPVVMVMIAVLLVIPVTREAEPPEAAGESGNVIPVPKGRGFRKTAWIANFALNCCFGGAVAMFPKLATSLNIGADVHGWLMALSRGAALLIFLPLHWLGFWRTRLWPLWVAQLIAAAGIAWIGWGNMTWMFALAFAAAGAVSGYTYQASIVFTLEEMTEKGKGSGFHEAMVGAGMFSGPLLAGLVGEHTSLSGPYYFCAALLVVLIAVQMVLVYYRRKQQ